MSGILDRIRRAARPPFHTLSPQQARLAYTAAAEVLDFPRLPLGRVEDVVVPMRDGTRCPGRLYAADHACRPIILYLHGGGFVIGNLETHNSLCRQLAARGDVAVLALDYRLAPEHPFPTAVEDSFDALAWLAGLGARQLGLDGTRLAVGGDSAGGTLAAVCALMARDAALPLSLQLLITPGTTAHADTASHRMFAQGFLLDAIAIAWFFDHYIPRHHRNDWRFSPLNAPELEAAAPACVILAECDPLVDEGLAYADRLRAAGVTVTLELYRGMTHDFIKMGRLLKEADHALAAAGHALKEVWV